MKLQNLDAMGSSRNGTALNLYSFNAEASGDEEEKQLAVFGKRQQLRARSSPAITSSLFRTDSPYHIAQLWLLFYSRLDLHFDGDMGRPFLVSRARKKRSYRYQILEFVNLRS